MSAASYTPYANPLYGAAKGARKCDPKPDRRYARGDGAEAGMHLVALLPPRSDDVAVSRKAGRKGISAMPLSSCYLKPPPRGGLILGYGGANAHQIHDGIRKLRRFYTATSRTVVARTSKHPAEPYNHRGRPNFSQKAKASVGQVVRSKRRDLPGQELFARQSASVDASRREQARLVEVRGSSHRSRFDDDLGEDVRQETRVFTQPSVISRTTRMILGCKRCTQNRSNWAMGLVNAVVTSRPLLSK